MHDGPQGAATRACKTDSNHPTTAIIKMKYGSVGIKIPNQKARRPSQLDISANRVANASVNSRLTPSTSGTASMPVPKTLPTRAGGQYLSCVNG